MSKKIEDKYKILSHIDHILLRPQTYVGSNKIRNEQRWLVDKDKMTKSEVSYIPSFIKIFDEVITNSIDESRRNKKLNRIDVCVDKDKISIKDNGGIPVVKHKEYKIYVPEVIFGNLMSGTNYDDTEERTVAGVNGLGSKLTNIFSTEFSVSTCDGKKCFKQKFENNMRVKGKPSVKKGIKKHTHIEFKPDLEKFGMKDINNDHYKIIEKRVYDLAACNPKVKIYFNGKQVKIDSFENYISLYVSDYLYESNKGNEWEVGVALSEDGFEQISFVNSTETYDGGTHVDYVMNQIITELRAYFNKKHKFDVKPSELKQHMLLLLNCTIINPSFSSQTKEKLITEVKDFGQEFVVSKKLINSILKSEIVNSVLDWIEQKKQADENKLQRKVNKNLSKIKVEKLIDSKGKDRIKHSLGLYEGDSAVGAFRKYRNTQTMGAFALRGKFMNVSEVSNAKLVKNAKVVNIMAAIGLKLGQPLDMKNIRYGKVLLYVDSDHDGNSIASLLLNFFYTYWPEMFDKNMIYKVETPIVVAIPRNNKLKKISLYNQKEYKLWSDKHDLKKFDIKYKKGLAALVGDEYNDIINNPRLTLITKDIMAGDSLNTWFGKESDLRKDELLE
jgi:DNA topoisomerase-2